LDRHLATYHRRHLELQIILWISEPRPHIKFVSRKLELHVNWEVGSLLVMDNLLGSMSWNEEERATLIRKKEKPTHDGGWELNFTSIPASPASLLVGSDRPWTLPVKLLDTWGVLDWHSKRGIIQRLYFTEDKTLGEIMRVMKIEHSFDAR
jgi:hypothetical protein